MLHYKDRRSVRRWCRNNGIRILCDLGSNRHYILKVELENVKSRLYNKQQNYDNSIIPEFPDQKTSADTICESEQIGLYERDFLKLLQNI